MTSKAMPLSELLRDLGATVYGEPTSTTITGLTTDSRRVEPGNLFVALRGARIDGLEFITDAVQRGAAAVLSHRKPALSPAVPLFTVADPESALATVAGRFHGNPAAALELIGVTGTNGKTTTSLLLASILEQAGYRVGIIGTLNYRWAGKVRPAPLTTPGAIEFHGLLAEMRADRVTHVVMEVSSHALSLKRVSGCRFRLGVFTNLSRDHLDFHGGLEQYFLAKSELFTRHLIDSEKRVTALVNADDPYGRRLKTMAAGPCWSYAVDSREAEVTVARAVLKPAGIRATLTGPLGPLEIHSPLLGRLNLYNITAAAAAAMALGIAPRGIAAGIARVDRIDGRLQKVANNRGYQVVVDFAHTPDAMEKSLECLRELTSGRLWVVFGCGGDRDRGKRPMMGEIAARYGDRIVVTSDNPRTENPRAIIAEIEPGLRSRGLKPLSAAEFARGESAGYLVEPDREQAIKAALATAVAGDLIFIGGKGHETYQIVGTSVRPFDDRKVVTETLQELEAVAS